MDYKEIGNNGGNKHIPPLKNQQSRHIVPSQVSIGLAYPEKRLTFVRHV